MEEIDNIIIKSLQNLECDISEDIDNLKQFDADIVLNSITTCLKTIKPDLNYFPKKLPPNMSQRLKVASDVAMEIKNLGFRGDMGYQTILYCNEVEVRRVLMFLIERLPRDTSKIVQIEQTGFVPRLIKQIEENLKLYNKQLWLPAGLLKLGAREVSETFIINSFGNSCIPNPVSLIIPDERRNLNHEIKQYFVHIVPEVTNQCSNRQLIPSLLFNDCIFEQSKVNKKILNRLNSAMKINFNPENINDKIINPIKIPSSTFETAIVKNEEITEEQIESLKEKIEIAKQKNKNLEIELGQINSKTTEEEIILKETLNKVRLKKQTLAIANDSENVAKLKQKVEIASETLVELAKQWNDVQTPLLEEYRSLQNSLSAEEEKLQQDESILHNLKNIHKDLLTDFKEKEILEQTLVKKVEQINKTNNRSSYTRRILEIIGNIKKQNNEIQKVLKDTKEVQKDISNLTGQVDRSFTMCDEIIFHDAKQDETARKAYKLLASLRQECSDILKAVSDLGAIERETRNLQEQIETEKAKEMAVKLDRVTKDLEEIKRETQVLLTKLREEQQ